jgi:hypothetical protein
MPDRGVSNGVGKSRQAGAELIVLSSLSVCVTGFGKVSGLVAGWPGVEIQNRLFRVGQLFRSQQ